MTLPAPTADFWKHKLAAFLHDSPSKALDIAEHEDRAANAYKRAGLEDFIKNYNHNADHTAAAADRVPWPSRKISCRFDGVNNRFHHPLDGRLHLPPESRPLQVTDAEATEGALQPQLDLPVNWDEVRKARAHFFAHWRLWRRNCAESNPALGFLPAETRLPDHSIWHHMGMVSALAATHGQPAFLKLQLGPVQDFIAAARSTRDLWSASYLLSWLMATGLATLAREIGPDSVIFPSLYGQPLFDLQFRDELWAEAKTSHQEKALNAWESLGHSAAELLTPNLPNIFLAIVPAAHAAELGQLVAKAIRDEWEKIAEHVWEFSAEVVTAPHSPTNAKERFFAQVERHLDLSWQATPWPASPDEALASAEKLLPKDADGKPNPTCDRLRKFLHYFSGTGPDTMPVEHRDRRYYTDDSKTKLNNVGSAWSVLYTLNGWQLDATRQTRAFRAWSVGGTNCTSSNNAKDALTGREEMIVGGKSWHDSLTGKWTKLFRHSDEVGAITLIKRTWHLAYLEKVKRLPASPENGFRMPNTQEIAAYQPDAECDATPETATDERTPYFAIIALDGDSIGKIVSGEKCPDLGNQLADYPVTGDRHGTRDYFDQHRGTDLLKLQRPLSPSFHLQFSEALSNFALHCVGPIVKAHQGKVLYAGGDDVLAMLPASEAIACADALQRAFRGEDPASTDYLLQQIAPGFLARTDRQSDQGKLIPFIVPGPACTVSVGIAIAHAKSPLQDAIREAHRAEKRAKQLHADKHALAVTVLKRSGEITEWASRFGRLDEHPETPAHRDGVLALNLLAHCLNEKILSAKFPHRLIALLEPYVPAKQQDTAASFNAHDVLTAELSHALSRQHGENWATNEQSRRDADDLISALLNYARSIPDDGRCASLNAVIQLCIVAAFLRRQTES